MGYRQTRAYLRMEAMELKEFNDISDISEKFLVREFINETPAGGDILDLMDVDKLKLALLACFDVSEPSEVAHLRKISRLLYESIIKSARYSLSEMFEDEKPSEEDRKDYMLESCVDDKIKEMKEFA